MGAHIMALANRLVYRGELACGDAAVAGRQLALQVPLPPSAPHWLAQALRPERSVLLLDTDALGARCAATARPLRNVGEALVCARLATALYRSAALSHGQLLLLTPYNAQVEALREALAAADCDAEASTVDRAQGRDVPAVILSATATLPLPRSDLLAEQRRLCVALTRAQAKLIIVGSAAALRGAPLTQRLVEECDARGWTLQLPADALE
jgi:DNA replication ATP-dependent helicase Dna2